MGNPSHSYTPRLDPLNTSISGSMTNSSLPTSLSLSVNTPRISIELYYGPTLSEVEKPCDSENQEHPQDGCRHKFQTGSPLVRLREKIRCSNVEELAYEEG